MYKDIVVCLNESEERDNTIRTAAVFANEHNAGLVGLYISRSDVPAIPPFGTVSADLIKEAEERSKERADESRESFLKIADSLNCSATWIVAEEQEHPMKVITYSDLVITSQTDYDPRLGSSNLGFINNLLLGTGKPVVLVPPQWQGELFGNRIVLGWDESREAVRALQDALPLMKQAERVDVLAINYAEHKEVIDVSEITAYLTQRNVNSNFHMAVTDEVNDTPERVMMKFAADHDSDLLVIGAYGHSRLREIILGGVTRHMIRNSTIPVLFSH